MYDELLSPPKPEPDGTRSLDKDIERRTAVMILTGHDSGLSSPIDFYAIRSSSLPIARDDVDAIGASNVIRVPLKTAVHFIAKLQQREEAASRSSKSVDAEELSQPRKRIFWEDVENANDYAEAVLDRPYEHSSKKREPIMCWARWKARREASFYLVRNKMGSRATTIGLEVGFSELDFALMFPR